MKLRTPLLVIGSALLGYTLAIALPRLWGFTTTSFTMGTGAWLVICLLVGTTGFLLGSLLWLSIPRRIRQHLDWFSSIVRVRLDSVDAHLSQGFTELYSLLEQYLDKKERESLSASESILAEYAAFTLEYAIASSHQPAGHCKFCGGRHPEADKLSPGDPKLYSYAAHQKLPNGHHCPVPYAYQLSQDRQRSRAKEYQES